MHIHSRCQRDAVACLIVAFAAAFITLSPPFNRLHGLSIDTLTALRWHAFGHTHDPRSSPTVVVALDEESYRTAPFAGTPNVTWTREIGRVLTAVIDGGAKVVGFDIIFPTSIEQSEIPFGEETLGARVRGFDREFLQALASAARADKLVLGEIQHTDQPIPPAPGQRVAVGQQRNIRPLNVFNDADDVIRRVPLSFVVDGKPVPSISVELASRALGTHLHKGPDGAMRLGNYRIPTLVPNAMALNFEGGADDIPTYSLADLRACLDQDPAYFHRQFNGKIVLIGTLLDVEDRKVTSKRYATAPEGSFAERCVLHAPTNRANSPRDSISGVYVQASAVNNLLRGDALREFGLVGTGFAALFASGVAAATALAFGPATAALIYLALGILYTTAATIAFEHALALPLAEALSAGLIALATTIGYRFVIADKDKRALRKNFALYLAPSLVDRMLASDAPPALGGELRQVTLFFSDLADFSAFAEQMTPSEVVSLMNEYLSAMTDVIEACGGFVDKYVGDAIAAVFGAPVDDPEHAIHAVRAALGCLERLKGLNQAGEAFAGRRLRQRIGLNSGTALVGNIGSRRRFNYTAMGDAVNLASRLEGANKYYGTSIIASEATMLLTQSLFCWRELDAIRVKGRSLPLKIYEPLAEVWRATPEQVASVDAYARGLASWRTRDFAGAVGCFVESAVSDLPSALFLERAKQLEQCPPRSDWQPINNLEAK